MYSHAYRAAAALLLLLVAATADAQEWTRFRGPNGSGQSDATTIPASWGKDDYLWQVGLPGIGHSSPVLWGERIFLTSAEPKDGQRHVLCVSARDGRQLWQKDYPAETYRIHTQNSLASSTPAVDERHVYSAWATPEDFFVLALAHDGREAWQTRLGSYHSQHGFGTSPIVYRDLLIITDEQEGDSFLIALDCATGAIRWRVPRKVHDEQNTSYAAPCIYRTPAGRDELIVASWAHGISSLEPLTGHSFWEAAVLERRPVGSPILVDGLILANCGEGSGNNNVVAIRPPSADGATAETVYKLDKTYAPYVPSLIAHGPLVFLWGDRGIVSCIDAATGKIHWRERVGGNYSSSPVRAADRIYCTSTTGEVVALAAGSAYQLLGRSDLGEATRATPAVAGGRMFLRTESRLFAVGQK